MTNLARIMIILSAAIISGCGPVETKTVANHPEEVSVQVVPFCDIATNPKMFVGKIVTTLAQYSVVKNYDSFFSGIGCPDARIVGEGSVRSSDKSVSNFYHAGDALCRDRKSESLCTLKAEVVMVVKMRINDDGELVADPIHVKSFSFLPESSKDKKSE